MVDVKNSDNHQNVLNTESVYRYLDLEYLADVAPVVFEEIALNLDRNSIYSMLRTNKNIRTNILKMMNSNNTLRRVNPFRETTVVINRTYWNLGFNRFNFFGYLEKAEQEGKQNIVQMKKPVGRRGRQTEMVMNDLAGRLKYFNPKKFVFKVDYNPFLIEKHLRFLSQVDAVPGTTIEIIKVAGLYCPIICAALMPKELILVSPLLNIAFQNEYFEDEAFQCVQHLRIREYDANRFQGANAFIIKPLSDNLITFDFTGNLPGYPCDQINILLKKWCDGKNPLREIKFVMGVKDEMEMVLFNSLIGISNTAVDHITQLPDFMQEKILKDLMGLDWKNADIAYRLLISPSKRQVGCIYYSHCIPSSTVDGPGNTACSYLGFHAFDYFPVKKSQ